jgi:thioredoxin
VLRSAKPVLVEFWAPWCAPCALVGPVVEELAERRAGALEVLRMDIDTNVATTARYSVFSIPTLIVFKDGREQERLLGAQRLEDLDARIRPHLTEAG